MYQFFFFKFKNWFAKWESFFPETGFGPDFSSRRVWGMNINTYVHMPHITGGEVVSIFALKLPFHNKLM